jgi:hypothetical protein
MPLSNEELAERLTALEKKVEQSLLLMRRPGSENYERLVDVVCDHENTLRDLEGRQLSSGLTSLRNEDRLSTLEEKITSKTAKGL